MSQPQQKTACCKGGGIVRLIIGVIAVVAIIFALKHVKDKRFLASHLGPVDRLYEDAKTREDFDGLKQDYEAMLAQAGSKHKAYIEGQIASCEAWMAFHDTSDRPSIRKYADCIAKMEKAQKLSGDKQGVWARTLREFRARHKESQGPTADEMRATFARLAKLSFGKAMADLETLYRWKKIWHDQDLHVKDQDRNATFAKAHKALLAGYCEKFEASIQSARKAKGKSETALSTKSAPLGAVAQVGRFDKAKADGFRKKYASDMAAAKKASKELEKLMEKMMAGG